MLKKLILAAAGLLVAVPAFADGGHRDHHRRHQPQAWKHHWKHHPHAGRVVVMPPPRVYYVPPPVYHTPPPVVYRAPLPPSGVSIRLHFPL